MICPFFGAEEVRTWHAREALALSDVRANSENVVGKKEIVEEAIARFDCRVECIDVASVSLMLQQCELINMLRDAPRVGLCRKVVVG
jgi:hypothetical protein